MPTIAQHVKLIFYSVKLNIRDKYNMFGNDLAHAW